MSIERTISLPVRRHLPGVRVPAVLEGMTSADRVADALHEAWRRPKVELHLHLEGTLRPATVCELAARHDPTSTLTRTDWQDGFWTFRDLAGFVQQFRTVHRACVRDLSDLERLAREGFEDLALQNVRYAEVSWSARPPSHPLYVPLRDALGAIDRARRDIEDRTNLRVGLILAINRAPGLGGDDDARDGARSLVDAALRARDDGVNLVGVDVHGDEQSHPGVGPFVDAFQLAARAGLGLRAHAGEGAGPESVRAAVDMLGVHRIGHGVRAVEDPALLARLGAARVPLDVCPTSNLRTATVSSVETHPIRHLLASGIPVTISSDDPIVFDTCVTAELALLHLAYDFSWHELGELTMNAVDASFLPAAERAALRAEIAPAWS
jgi:adenosine deaminase